MNKVYLMRATLFHDTTCHKNNDNIAQRVNEYEVTFKAMISKSFKGIYFFLLKLVISFNVSLSAFVTYVY